MRVALATTFGLFAVWGLAQWMYAVLFPQFAQFFQLDASQSAGAQALFNMAYWLLAMPAALFHRKFGYKVGVIFALSIFSLGPFLLYPAITRHGYSFFLGAIVVMGAAWAWLETSINPLAVELGRRETAVPRLNLAQAFYPVGLIAGTYLANWLLEQNYQLTGGALAQAIARPYVWVGLGVLMVAFAVEHAGLSSLSIARAEKASRVRTEIRTLLQNPLFRLGAVSLFFYVLAQSATWGVTFGYAMRELANPSPATAGRMITWSCILLGVGRFVGAAVMRWVDPNRLLAACAVMSLVLVFGAAAFSGVPGLMFLMSASFFMAIMYATVFATSIRDLGPLIKTGSGLLVSSAGLAAAISPLLMQFATQNFSVHLVCLLPVPSFLVILAFAFKAHRYERHEESRAAEAA
jgi:FHS family L-fucose permease-like MFS transporter